VRSLAVFVRWILYCSRVAIACTHSAFESVVLAGLASGTLVKGKPSAVRCDEYERGACIGTQPRKVASRKTSLSRSIYRAEIVSSQL